MQYTKNTADHQEPVDVLPLQQAFKGGLYITLGKGLSFLASFVVVTVIGNFLPRETAGSYNYIIAILGILSIATLPGMNSALARAVAKNYPGTVRPLMKTKLMFGSFGSLLAIIIGGITIMHGDTILGIALIVSAPFIPLTDTLSNITFNFWQGKKRFDKSALMHTTYYVSLALMSIPFFIFTQSLIIIVIGVLTAQMVAGFAIYQSIPKTDPELVDPEAKKLGFHLTITQGIRILSSNIDRIIVFYISGPALVAVYTFASTPILKMMQMIPIGNVALPHLSTHTFSKKIKHDLLKKTGLLFIIITPIVGILILLAPILYQLFFPKYPESVQLFQILSISLIFLPVGLLKSSLIAFYKTKSIYLTEIIGPVLKIILMISLGIYFGLLGICIGYLISGIIESCITCIHFYKLPAH